MIQVPTRHRFFHRTFWTKQRNGSTYISERKNEAKVIARKEDACPVHSEVAWKERQNHEQAVHAHRERKKERKKERKIFCPLRKVMRSASRKREERRGMTLSKERTHSKPNVTTQMTLSSSYKQKCICNYYILGNYKNKKETYNLFVHASPSMAGYDS